jgi:hypothetical protein
VITAHQWCPLHDSKCVYESILYQLSYLVSSNVSQWCFDRQEFTNPKVHEFPIYFDASLSRAMMHDAVGRIGRTAVERTSNRQHKHHLKRITMSYIQLDIDSDDPYSSQLSSSGFRSTTSTPAPTLPLPLYHTDHVPTAQLGPQYLDPVWEGEEEYEGNLYDDGTGRAKEETYIDYEGGYQQVEEEEEDYRSVDDDAADEPADEKFDEKVELDGSTIYNRSGAPTPMPPPQTLNDSSPAWYRDLVSSLAHRPSPSPSSQTISHEKQPSEGRLVTDISQLYGVEGTPSLGDEDKQHFGPAPSHPMLRRNKTKKRIALTNGNLVLDLPIPTRLAGFLPRKGEEEFMTMRCVLSFEIARIF